VGSIAVDVAASRYPDAITSVESSFPISCAELRSVWSTFGSLLVLGVEFSIASTPWLCESVVKRAEEELNNLDDVRPIKDDLDDFVVLMCNIELTILFWVQYLLPCPYDTLSDPN